MRDWLGLAVLALLMPVWMTVLLVGAILWMVWQVAYSLYGIARTTYLKRYRPEVYAMLESEGFEVSQRIMAAPRQVRPRSRR